MRLKVVVLFRFCKKMCDNKVGAIMVLENFSLVRIFNERDLMSRMVAEGLDP